MRKLILMAPLLLLAAAEPAHSQGAQFPSAGNAESPPSINSPPLTSLNSSPQRGVSRRPFRSLRHRRAAGRQHAAIDSAAFLRAGWDMTAGQT